MEPDAEADLYRRLFPRARLLALRVLRNEAEAEDIAQHVMIHTLEALREGRVRDPEQVASYVLSTCRVTCRDTQRTRVRRAELLERWPHLPLDPPEPEVSASREHLGRCLEELTPRDRTVVVLTYYADRTSTEIARELEMSEGNVRVARHRAVSRLAQCMGAVTS